jgi:hypothetical protein
MAVFYNPGGIQQTGLQFYLENNDYQSSSWERAESYLVQWKNVIVADWQLQNKTDQNVAVSAYCVGDKAENGWGITYKRVVSNFGDNGYTLDFGLLIDLGNTLKLGLLAQDFFKEKVDVRTTLRSGLSFWLLNNQLLLAVDNEFYRSPEAHFIMHYGLEYALTKDLDVRAGWDDGDLTGGISLFFGLGSLEYGITTSEDLDTESCHRIALNFGRRKKIPPLPRQQVDRSYKPREAEIRRLQQRYQKNYYY